MEMFWKVKNRLSLSYQFTTANVRFNQILSTKHNRNGSLPSFAPFSVKNSVAVSDPGSGAFMALGSGIGFFSDPGSQTYTIFLRA
jgi:hypothetical protein